MTRDAVQQLKTEWAGELMRVALLRVSLLRVALLQETYHKDCSLSHSMLRRDVKPGRSRMRMYFTEAREVVLMWVGRVCAPSEPHA
jgi:hypothetical protein